MNNQSFTKAIRSSPYVYTIGVAGDSGSGKSTFSGAISTIFGEELVSSITVDDYHILDRNERAERGITPLDPRATDLKRLAIDIRDLRNGKPIQKPVYSHVNGTIEPVETFVPTKFIIIEGLHPFLTEELRNVLDFTIFVDPDREVKHEWKIRRDVRKRNYLPEEVFKEIKKREPDFRKYVLPQRAVADAIISIRFSTFGRALGMSRNVYSVSLSMNHTRICLEDIELNIDLCGLFTRSSHSFSISCTSSTIDQRQMRTLAVDGILTPDTILKIEKNIEYQTKVRPIDIFSGTTDVTASDLVRLIISWLIINHRIIISTESAARSN